MANISIDYSVSINGEHAAGGWMMGMSAAEAVDYARKALTKAGTGTARIERCKRGTVGRSGLYHPWLQWREYRCGSDGIVRRTDR